MTLEPARLSSPVLPADDEHFAGIVIPTIGKSSVVPEAYRCLVERLPPGVRVVVVVNPVDPNDAALTAQIVQAIGAPAGGTLDIVTFEGPVGFGGAFNAGLAFLANTGGVPPFVVCYNDDLRATPHWLESLAACFDPEGQIMLCTEGPDPKTGIRRTYPVKDHGRIGLAGPVTTVAAGMQGACDPGDVAKAGSHDRFAEQWRAGAQDCAMSASFLSGFCIAISRECAQDLLVACPVAGFGPFDSAQYPIAGYEDNDLAVRARNAGWKCAIDWGSYVGHIGHQSFDSAFPEMQRGMRNRANYYAGHVAETQRPQTLAALYRVRVGSVHDLHLLRASLERHAAIADGVAVVLTNNPARDLPAYPDWPAHQKLQRGDQLFLRALAGTMDTRPLADGDLLPAGWEPERDAWKLTDDVGQIAEIMRNWVAGVVLNAPGSRIRFPDGQDGNLDALPVKVEVWAGTFNERDERNRTIELAESLGTDWLLSVDGDEVIEDRIRREHFERWMSHPDPLVGQWNFGWLDHWNDAQHFRTDPPWGDGGAFTQARHGRRLWRARTGRILAGTENGLHCGNLPDCGPLAMRVTGARFRHFGYVRPLDREHRFANYQRIDPNPNPVLVGGTTYRHIVASEGMRIERYNAHNGIGLHMLVYENTDPDRVAGLLDALYGVVDHIVLVWTSSVPPEDSMPPALFEYARLFKADIMHCDLRQDGGVNFAAVRNAAIRHLAAVNEQHKLGIGWGMFIDPDESFSASRFDPAVTLRRMAESTESWAWMFEYDNPIRTGTITPSDSVRLFRLHPEMRMRGRVHESFDDALRLLVANGHTPNVRRAPFRMFNAGLMDGETCNRKLRMYAEGLVREIEENPDNGGAWYSLGLQLEAEGRLDEALICYQNSVAATPDSFIGYRALMMHHLTLAAALGGEMMQHLSPQHGFYRIGSAMMEFLRKATERPENPATRSVLDGITVPAAIPSRLRPDSGAVGTGGGGIVEEAVRAAQAAVDAATAPTVDTAPGVGEDGATPSGE